MPLPSREHWKRTPLLDKLQESPSLSMSAQTVSQLYSQSLPPPRVLAAQHREGAAEG